LTCRHPIFRVSPEWLGRLASVGDATKFAREAALKEFLKTGCEQPIPQAAAAASDTASLLEAAVQKVMSAERDAIEKLGGNDKTRNKLSAYLMGKLMKETRGAIDPQQVCHLSCGSASPSAQSNLHRA
jgi:Asp-tRNA(Asn)/Glu-tRNA(Gln) amidotransferase B subunit